MPQAATNLDPVTTDTSAAASSSVAGAPPAASTADDKTLLAGGTPGSGANDAPPVAVTATWPDDWREKASKGDEKRLGILARYTSPEAAMDALFALRQRLNSGELKAPLSKDATPEELAAWRKENGIPEKADGYDLNIGDGYVIGEDDKPVINDFLNSAHAKNMSPEQVKNTLLWYYQTVEKQAQMTAEKDVNFRASAEDELRAEWGGEYRRNVNLIGNLLSGAPEGVSDNLMGARLADGSLLGDNPKVMRFLADLSRQLNPAGTIAPGASSTLAETIASEKAQIEKIMRDDRKAYDKDSKMRERYRELIDAELRMKGNK